MKINTKEFRDMIYMFIPFCVGKYSNEDSSNHVFISWDGWIWVAKWYWYSSTITSKFSYEWDVFGFVVDTKKMFEIMKAMECEFIDIEEAKWEIIIKWQNKKLRMPNLNIKEYVSAEEEDDAIKYKIWDNMLDIFKRSIGMIIRRWCNPMFEWLCLQYSGWKWWFCCTDSTYMMLSNTDWVAIDWLDSYFFPRDAIDKILKIWNWEEWIIILWKRNIIIEFGDTRASFLQTSVNIPDFVWKIPNHENYINFAIKDVVASLSLVKKLYNITYINLFVDDVIKVSWDWFDEIIIDWEIKWKLEVSLNLDFLLKILSQWEENATIYFNWSNIVKILLSDHKSEVYLLAPMLNKRF